MNEVLKLAKELQEYTKVVGSHNIHIQEIANELVEALDQPQLNENQQIVLEWLKGRYKGGSSLFNAIQGFRGFDGVPAIELNALMSLSNNEESQVLQAFATWVLKQEEE